METRSSCPTDVSDEDFGSVSGDCAIVGNSNRVSSKHDRLIGSERTNGP
jgi:hypothetical protein